MKKLIMFVYNDITTDARVQRAATALADVCDLTLISTDVGKTVANEKYRNILVGHGYGQKNMIRSIFLAWGIIRRERPEIVYCHDYYSALLAYLLLRTKYNGKIIYDAHELMLPEAGKKSNRQSFFYWFERKIVKRVSLLICASEQRGKLMKEHYGLHSIPLTIPNISQLCICNDDECENILSNLSDFFSCPGITLVYAGSVASERHIIELLDAAISLKPDYKLLILGRGDAAHQLRQKASEHIDLISLISDPIPYKCLGAVLSRCDIGYIYYPVTDMNNKYCASNKLYEYASVGLPVITNTNPTLVNEVSKAGIGVASNDFVSAIQQVSSHLSEYKDACQRFTKDNQWTTYAKRLVEEVMRVLE